MLKLFCVFGAVLGFLGVAAGSFGAHGLKDLLEANGHAANWETAVRYCLFHAVVLIAQRTWKLPARGSFWRQITEASNYQLLSRLSNW